VEGGFTPGLEPQPVGTRLPKLRAMNLGDVIGGAFEIYGKSAVQMWQIVALVVIPITILEVIISRVTLPSDVYLQNGSLYTHMSTTSNGGGISAVFVLNLLGTWLAAGALFHLQLDTYLERAHTSADSLAYFGRRAGQLLWLGVVVLVAVAIGLILLIVPGIWLGVGLSIAFPVLMLEGLTGVGAARRSMQLVQDRWWVTFGRLIVAYLIYGFWTAIVGSIGGAIGNGVTNVTVYEIVRGLANAVGFILAYPFITAVINLIYLDLRVRKDGITEAELLERPRDPSHTVGAPIGGPPGAEGGMPSQAAEPPPPEDEPPAPAAEPPPPEDEPPAGGSVTRY
jgi:hypothetical protein